MVGEGVGGGEGENAVEYQNICAGSMLNKGFPGPAAAAAFVPASSAAPIPTAPVPFFAAPATPFAVVTTVKTPIITAMVPCLNVPRQSCAFLLL